MRPVGLGGRDKSVGYCLSAKFLPNISHRVSSHRLRPLVRGKVLLGRPAVDSGAEMD